MFRPAWMVSVFKALCILLNWFLIAMRSAVCSLALVLLSPPLFKCWCFTFDAWEIITLNCNQSVCFHHSLSDILFLSHSGNVIFQAKNDYVWSRVQKLYSRFRVILIGRICPPTGKKHLTQKHPPLFFPVWMAWTLEIKGIFSWPGLI